VNSVLADFFRYPEGFAHLDILGGLSAEEGFFTFGPGITCYGRCAGGTPVPTTRTHELNDVFDKVQSDARGVRLPFDFDQVVNNLRYERYIPKSNRSHPSKSTVIAQVYYFFRPLMPVKVRKYLQRAHLSGWQRIDFPRWPVDFTVDSLMERTLGLMLKARNMRSVPFIWFWPHGAPSCAMMTHDVETKLGRDFCRKVMDLDDSHAIKSSFQLIPETRYDLSNGFLDSFRARRFEVNVHDLNHDGCLFREKEEFLRRATMINKYAREFGTQGFRSGAMYRNQNWYDAFEFSIDMSVPSVAHLEPQRGGCCTSMPYFIGDILELPLTTIQDYSLFNILSDYSINIWKQQIELIMQRNGLISFITHPDYLIEGRAQRTYLDLLSHLAQLRTEKRLWVALPSEVNRWWRSRQQMRLFSDGHQWRIEGPDSERARVAFARLDGDRVTYSVDAAGPELSPLSESQSTL